MKVEVVVPDLDGQAYVPRYKCDGWAVEDDGSLVIYRDDEAIAQFAKGAWSLVTTKPRSS